MAILRTGIYGNYYGSVVGTSSTLTTAQMQVNATYIMSFLVAKGWSLNAIAGILGNMQHESALNPGRWQSDVPGNMSSGYGLTQWTPASKHTQWCADNGYDDYSTMDANLEHIIYEKTYGGQYYPTASYPETFTEFSVSTKTPYYLACAFAWNYERSWVVLYGSEEEKEALRQKRGNAAASWYEYLTGVTPDNPVTPSASGKRKKYNFVLFNRRRRFYG